MSSQGSYMTILQEFHGAVLVEVRKIWRPRPRSRRGPWEWRLRRSWWNPARGPCMISFRSLTSSCTGPYQKILWRSCSIPLWEVLAWSCTGPSQKILWRSWWDPLYKVLAWGACTCHILEVLLWKLLWEALGGYCIKILQDPHQQQQVLFWRSCEILLGVQTRRLVRRSCRDRGEIL